MQSTTRRAFLSAGALATLGAAASAIPFTPPATGASPAAAPAVPTKRGTLAPESFVVSALDRLIGTPKTASAQEAGYSWGNGYPPLNNSVEVGGVTFRYPDAWPAAEVLPGNMTAELYPVNEATGASYDASVSLVVYDLAAMGFTLNSYGNYEAREVFEWAVNSRITDGEFDSQKCWGSTRMDQGTVPEAKAALVHSTGKGVEMGSLFMAILPNGRLYTMTLMGGFQAVHELEELVGAAWDAVDWAWMGMMAESPASVSPASVPPASAPPDPVTPANASIGGTDWEAYRQMMLDAAIKNNSGDSTWFNPYWTIVDFDFDLITDEYGETTVENPRYLLVTPWGAKAWSNEFTTLFTVSGGTWVTHWAMPCHDGSGDLYWRTTGYVYGLGEVVDLAYYEGYSQCWYVATTGRAVYTDWEGSWTVIDDGSVAPWTPRWGL